MTFKTFQKYCNQKTTENIDWARCGKFEKPGVKAQFCGKKICPVFKRLKEVKKQKSFRDPLHVSKTIKASLGMP